MVLTVIPQKLWADVHISTYDDSFISPDQQFVEYSFHKAVTPVPLYRANFCSCVSFIKSITGYTEPVGLAKNWPVNFRLPAIGEVVVTRENPYTGHVAMIIDIQGNDLILEEANYVHCTHTKGRKLPIDSSLIIGYW